jgi:hypothetical protein
MASSDVSAVTNYFATPNEGFSTTLNSNILSGAATVPLASVTGLVNGKVFVGMIEPGLTNQQVFTGIVDTGGSQITGVKWTRGTNVAHASGVSIVDYVTGTAFKMMSTGIQKSLNQDGSLISTAVQTALGQVAATGAGWTTLGVTPSTITANGNRSYQVVVNASDQTGTLSKGMRLMFQRTVAAPTQCTSLNGTTQFWSKASPNKLTFTVTYTLSAWIKVTSYAQSVIVSRLTGTSGWAFDLNSSGQLRIFGENTGNGKQALSYQSVPLNKWIHVAASMDMTSGGLLYIDGVLVPSLTSNLGAGAVALAQSGDLNVGAIGGAQFFPGKIAQVAIYDAVISAANILATVSQTLSGSETSLKSAYSFNAVVTDLNTATPNDLTANGSAVATNADSPFAQGATAGTLEYGIITAASFSTNTTLTVQVPEGSAIPTSGGVSAISYSTVETPYGFPGWFKGRNLGVVYALSALSTTDATGIFQDTNIQLVVNVPSGVQFMELLAYVPYVSSTSASMTNRVVGIREGSTTITDTQTQGTSASAARNGVYVSAIIPFPTAGSHTYKLSQAQNQVGTQTLAGLTTEPIYVMARICD